MTSSTSLQFWQHQASDWNNFSKIPNVSQTVLVANESLKIRSSSQKNFYSLCEVSAWNCMITYLKFVNIYINPYNVFCSSLYVDISANTFEDTLHMNNIIMTFTNTRLNFELLRRTEEGFFITGGLFSLYLCPP